MAGIKQHLKVSLKQARRLYLGTFHAFSPEDLIKGIATLGVRTGDTVLAHSSYDAFQGFSGKPTDIISGLQSVVGSAGAVLVPTLPFEGTAVAYARANPVFDVKRTPSRTGLLTELFRRLPDVRRSVHPTHPVAVWGRGASQLVDAHHLARTPCGAGSPFARLLDMRGKILLLGTDISVLTFYHTIEELLERRFPVSPFTTEVFTLQSRDYSGNIVETQTRLFEPAMSKRRNLYKMVPELRKNGAWREASVGRLRVTLLHAEDVLSAVNALMDRGTYCYD